jgi:hypothetical protein
MQYSIEEDINKTSMMIQKLKGVKTMLTSGRVKSSSALKTYASELNSQRLLGKKVEEGNEDPYFKQESPSPFRRQNRVRFEEE